MDTMPPAPVPTRHRAWPWVLVALVALVALGAAAWLFRGYLPGFGVAPKSAAQTIVTMRAADGNARYALSGASLVPAAATPVNASSTYYVHEAAAKVARGTPVLVSPSATGPARTVALAGADGSLAPLGSSAAAIQDLTARADGLVAYATSVAGTSTAAAHVFVVDSAQFTEPADLGPGSDPVFLSDGNVLALAPEGLVEINPAVSARSLRLGAPYATSTGPFLIAPSGTFAVLPNGVTGKEDVYAIDPAHPASLSYVGSLAMPTALGALDASSFVAQTAPDAATRYSVGASSVTPAGTLSISAP